MFLATVLEDGMNGKRLMDTEAIGLKWVPGRNGFVRHGDRGHGIARISLQKNLLFQISCDHTFKIKMMLFLLTELWTLDFEIVYSL